MDVAGFDPAMKGVNDSLSAQGPNSCLYHWSVGKLPLVKLTVAGADLKSRLSEGSFSY